MSPKDDKAIKKSRLRLPVWTFCPDDALANNTIEMEGATETEDEGMIEEQTGLLKKWLQQEPTRKTGYLAKKVS